MGAKAIKKRFNKQCLNRLNSQEAVLTLLKKLDMKQVFSLSFASAYSEDSIFRFIEENVRAVILETFVYWLAIVLETGVKRLRLIRI